MKGRIAEVGREKVIVSIRRNISLSFKRRKRLRIIVKGARV